MHTSEEDNKKYKFESSLMKKKADDRTVPFRSPQLTATGEKQ